MVAGSLVGNMAKADGGGGVSSRTCYAVCEFSHAYDSGARSEQAFGAHQMRGSGGAVVN